MVLGGGKHKGWMDVLLWLLLLVAGVTRLVSLADLSLVWKQTRSFRM